ncbi:MAG TPA: ABC transporter substrate-binding protein [Thermomicrobiales bacterium]|jgi:peptide/nickel transport system substrate-binding protein
MPENPIVTLNHLYLRFRDGAIDRRQFLLRASALGLSAASLSRFFSVLPATAAEPVQSVTRTQWRRTLGQAFPFTEDPTASRTGGTLKIGRSAAYPVTTLNLLLATDNPTQTLLNACQEYLVGISPIDGQFVPGLADAWEIASDGKTYTIHLNRDAHWHDGEPFTANDVVFSLRAQSDESTGTQFQASFVNAVESFRKLDSDTVELVATDVYAPVVFLGNTLTAILPKHIWGETPFKNWATDPGSTGADPNRVVGTGPFRFVSVSGARDVFTFDRYADYYDDSPLVDSLEVHVLSDEAQTLKALKSGGIDVYERPPVDTLSSLLDDPDFDVTVYDTYGFIWYGSNLDAEKTPLFQDVNVRRALMYGLDRKKMVKSIMRGFAEVAQGPQPLLSVAYDPDQITTKYGYDPAHAKQLLRTAGWSDENGDGILEKNGAPFSFDVMYGEESSQVESAVKAMGDYWRRLGIVASPKPVSFSGEIVPALFDTFDFQMVVLGFTWDATGDQSPMFGSAYKGVGFNAVGYSNPDYDRLADEANRETDPDARRELLIRAANIVNGDLPVGILWFRRDGAASSARVHNFVPNGRSALWSLRWVWVDT